MEALHDFFPTELLLILKACKASHSFIIVPLKVTVSLESLFSRNSSIAIIQREMSDSSEVFSLVKEIRLRRVGRHHS